MEGQLPVYASSTPYEGLLNAVAEMVGDGVSCATAATLAHLQIALNKAQRLAAKSIRPSCLLRTDSSVILREGELTTPLPYQIMEIVNARLIDDTCFVLDACESGWTKGTATTVTHVATYTHNGDYSLCLDLQSDPTGVVAYSQTKLGSITAFADGLSSRTTVTSTSHGLSNGDYVTIDGTTNYDGTWMITGVTANSFNIHTAYVANDATGTWFNGRHPGDLSAVTTGHVGFWVFSTVAIAAGGLSLTITEDASGAETTSYVTAALPAITARTWQYVKLSGLDLTSVDAFKSLGIKANSDIHDGTDLYVYIDGIHLYAGSYGGLNYPLHISRTTIMDGCVPNPEFAGQSRPVVIFTAGRPSGANVVETYPVPDKDYPLWVRYYKWPAPFDYANVPTATSELLNMDEVLITGAAWFVAISRRQWQQANFLRSEFYRLMREAASQDSRADGWEPHLGGFNPRVAASLAGVGEVPAADATSARGTTTGYYYFS
jgi:hypothetical protein